MFNTLKYAKMLEDAGFSRGQAETSIKILVEIMEEKLSTKQDLQDHRIATRQDIHEVRVLMKEDAQELKQEMREFKASVNHSLEQIESRLTIRMGTMLAASIAILTAVQKFIH